MKLVQTRSEETSGLFECGNAAFYKQCGDNFINAQRFRKFVNYLYIIIFP